MAKKISLREAKESNIRYTGLSEDEQRKRLGYAPAAGDGGEPQEQAGWRPDRQTAAGMMMTARQAETAATKGRAAFTDWMEGRMERLKKPLSEGRTISGGVRYNPQTRKLEETHIDAYGGRTFNKLEADEASRRWRQEHPSVDMTVGGQMRRAQERLQELTEKMVKRSQEIDEEARKIARSGDLFAGLSAANHISSAHRYDDEIRALEAAIHETEEQIQQLQNYQQKEQRGESWKDYFRSIGQWMSKPGSWDFGMEEMHDAATRKHIGDKMERGEKLTDAEEDVLLADYHTQEVMRHFGDLGTAARWGDITGMSLSAMKDFMLTGGFSGLGRGLATGAARQAAAAGARRAGVEVSKSAGEKLAKDGLFKFVRDGGRQSVARLLAEQGMGRAAGVLALRSLGVTADDLLVRAPLMTATVGAPRLAAGTIDNKLGEVTWDEKAGSLRYADGQSWGRAFTQTFGDQAIEYGSEMWGGGLPKLSDMTKVMGARSLTAVLLRSTREGAGTIASKTAQLLERAGINGYFGEVGEEYYGQLLRTVSGLDSAYTTDEQGRRVNLLADPQFHGDLWAGIALSVGLTGAFTMGGGYVSRGTGKGWNAAKYAYRKHEVNRADIHAEAIFGTEEWQPLKAVIDATENGNMGQLSESVIADTEKSDEQKKAVMDYMEKLMQLRGHNMAEYVDRRAMEERMAEVREFSGIEASGSGPWGEVYDRFKGKAERAARFLTWKGGGVASGVLHREETGDVDLVWGNERMGLRHMIEKHVVELDDFDSIGELMDAVKDCVENGQLESHGDNYVFTKDGYKAVVVKANEGQYVLTAYDASRPVKEKRRSEADATRLHQSIFVYGDGHLVPQDSASSHGKGNENGADTQEREAEMIAEDANNAYMDGYNAVSQEEMQDAANMYMMKRGDLAALFGLESASETEDFVGDPLAFAERLLAEEDSRLGAVLDYVNARMVYEGMMQRVRDDIDSRVASAEALVDSRVNRTTGMIEGATLKVQTEDGNDRRVYVVGGKLSAYEDGTGIDKEKSDSSIIIRDAETGKVEMVSPDAILSIEEPVDPETEKQTAAEVIRQQMALEAANRIEGAVPFNAGDTYTLTYPDGRREELTVVEENGSTDAGEGRVWVTRDGGFSAFPMSREEIQAGVDATNRGRAERFDEQRQAQMETETDYGPGDVLTLRGKDGETFQGEVVDPDYNDGTVLVQVETPAGPRVMPYTRRELWRMRVIPADEGNIGRGNIPQNGNIGPQNIPPLKDNFQKEGGISTENVATVSQEAVNNATVDDLMKTDGGYVEGYYNEHPEKVAEALVVPAQATADYINGKLTDRDYLIALGYANGNGSWLGTYASDEDIAREAAGNREKYLPYVSVPQAQQMSNIGAQNIPASADPLQAGVVGRSLSEEEAEALVSEMEAAAGPAPEKELTPAAWRVEFGDYGTVETPLGRVKLGENQISKLFSKGREKSFGMIRPTLETPQIIIEEPSSSADGEEERGSSYLFVRAFTLKNREKVYFFKSVTIKKDGLEVSVSNHLDRAKRIKESLKRGKLLYRNIGGAQTEQLRPTVSGTTSPTDNAGVSLGKVTENAGTVQTYGPVIPRDAKGRLLYEQADPDMAWDAIVEQAGGNEAMAQRVADSMVSDKEAELKKAEKDKPKGGTTVEEKLAAERERENAVERAKANLAAWQRIAQTSQRRKQAALAEQSRQAEEAARLRREKEERERADREEAERIRREALNGVPDDNRGTEGSVGQEEVERREAELASRVQVNDDDWQEGNGERPTYKRSIIIDGTHTATQIDEPDENGHYTGSYFEFDNKRFGDIAEIVNYIDNGNTLASKIAQAEAETDQNPTEAQKEAGNYKKGHVRIGQFNITVENPKGSVRRGTDENGNPWETTMQNTYGYIRGTEGVDGDHIDVFLTNDIDGWNGRRVYVVDQYNEDGTFDEHKVMLGFNDEDDARNAYFANYSDDWADKRKIVMTSTNLEDFEKWVDSSHRKTKPFAEYRSVRKSAGRTDSKAERIEKLRRSRPVIVRYNGEYDLNRKSAKEWLKENVRGTYTNADTGEQIGISRVGINEVTAHGSQNEAHLKSLSAIPQMIEQSVFIDEIPNTKGHDKYDSYRYYVCGLQIEGEDYTAKIVVGVKGDSKYYDHRLTKIEKGTLTDNLNGLSNSVVENQNALNGFISTGAEPDPSVTVGKDTKLVSILQTNGEKKTEDRLGALAKEAHEVFAEMMSASAHEVGINDNEVSETENTLYAPITVDGKGTNLSLYQTEPSLSSEEPIIGVSYYREGLTYQEASDLSEAYNRYVGKRVCADDNDALCINFGSIDEGVRFEAWLDGKDGTDGGDVLFREKEEEAGKSLVGVHNITEEKLDKAIRRGGLANPSVAVIDAERQTHEGYGEISLVMPSRMIDKRMGQNAGTFTNDAWTPIYPQIERQFGKGGSERAAQDIENVPEEMRSEVRQGINSWMDGRNGTGLEYLFLHERGEAPETVRIEAKYPEELRNEVGRAMNGKDRFGDLDDTERKAVLDILVRERYGGNLESYTEEVAQRIRKDEERVSKRPNSLFSKRLRLSIDFMKEHGYDYDEASSFANDVREDAEQAGLVNPGGTLLRAQEAIGERGLRAEYGRWLDGLPDRYHVKEVIFDGFTPSGRRRYVANTLKNVSRIMKKAGRNGATGLGTSFSNFAASVLKAESTLKGIRKHKKQLTADHKEVEAFREKWGNVYYELGEKLQPDAKGFEDYGLARLTEAATKSDPKKYVKYEYGVDLSEEDVRQLKEMVRAIREEYPAMYFETKFERPVGFHEFSAAVVPKGLKPSTRKALEDAGLRMYEYDPQVEGDRRRAFDEATLGEDIRFRNDDEIKEVNERFNEQLDDLTEENVSSIVFELGNPSDMLLSAGIPNKPLRLYGNKPAKKAKKHGFSIADVKDLPNAMQSPLFVFEGSHKDSYAVLTELNINGMNALVSIETNKDGEVDFNLVSSVFGKRNKGVVKWILDGKLRAVNKEKALPYISASAPIADATYKKELSDVTKIVQNFENPSVSGNNFRDTESGMEEVNERFNEQLDNFSIENADKFYFDLGMPSSELLAAGVENKPIRLHGSKVAKKMKKHGFDSWELKNLPTAVAHPIAVFDNLGRKGNRSILTELKTSNGNFLVTIDLGKGTEADFDVISSVFGKRGESVVEWINKGYMRFVDKEKALNYLHLSAPIAEALDSTKLSSAANIVKNFDNPSVSDENLRLGNGALTDDDLAIANDPVSKLQGKSTRTARQRKAFAERERRHMVERVQELADTLHLDNVDIVTDASTLQGRRAKAKGFYSRGTGRITIVIPNHTSVYDVEQTLLHEAVAHYGLRQLFGEHFDTFLDNVFQNADEDVRRRIVELAGRRGWDFRTATEEYLASLAENTNFDNTDASWWQKIKELFLRMLHKIGFENFSGVTLSDNELRYILWRSYENLAEPGRYRSILGEAEDVAKQNELKVGNYAPVAKADGMVAELHEADTPKTDRLRKLRKSRPVEITGEEIEASKDLRQYKKNALEYGKKLRGEYINKDTGEMISLTGGNSRGGIREILQHDYKDIEHLQSIAAIPKIIEESIFIDELPNEDFVKYPGVRSFSYYVCGLKIGDVDYTVKAVIANQNNGKRYYDHKLTQIEKGKLLSIVPTIQKAGIESNSPLSGVKDKRLLSILQADGEEKDMLFREGTDNGDVSSPLSGGGIQAWDKIASSTKFQLTETAFDYLNAVDKFQKLVSSHSGKAVEDFENAYDALTFLSSKNREEMDMFDSFLVKPLNDAIIGLTGKAGKRKDWKWDRGPLRSLVMYVEAKHGTERNRQMAVEAVAKADGEKADAIMRDWNEAKKRINSQEDLSWAERQAQLDEAATELGADISQDYSGLSSVFSDKEMYPEGWQRGAADYVTEYEETHGQDKIQALWKAINNATGFALQKQYETGLVSREYVERQKERFENYIPLRGFEDDTAGDVYNYLGHDYYPGSNPVKSARGRTSEPGNPFGSILNTAYASISSGNKNVAKTAFYALVVNHDTGGLAVANRAWKVRYADLKGNPELENIVVTPRLTGEEEVPEWVEAVPRIPEKGTAEEISKALSEFESVMNRYKEEGATEPIWKKSKTAYRTLYDERNEHEIPLYVAGDKYVVTITGNPRVAQAVNGLLNPDSGGESKLSEYAMKVQRFMAGAFTAKNAAFSIANLVKDTIYANNQAFIRENPKYWLLFTKNQKAGFLDFPLMMRRLYKYRKGGLDMNDKDEKMFTEFMKNGGATGYTFVNTQEAYAKELEKRLRELSKGRPAWFTPAGAVKLLFDCIEFAGQAAELVNRFAAYKTGREMGRSINRSIRDAKEITVNFNRKGAGRKTAGENNSALVNVAAAVSQYGRTSILFWNANMQSKYRFFKNLREHPVKTGVTLIANSMALSAILIPLLNNMVLPALYSAFGGGDGDDENADYFNALTDYERTHNICIRLPEQYWLKVPLSPEMVPWFSIGDAIGGQSAGKREMEASDIVHSMIDAVSPLAVNWSYEGWQRALNFLPTVGQPVAQNMMNVNFMGSPIKKTPLSARQGKKPEYTMVYRSASPTLVELSRLSNRVFGGEDDKTSGGTDWNPSMIQNLISGYTGGYGTTFLSVADWIVGTSKGEKQAVTFSRMPFVSRFAISGNKDVRIRRINSRFYDVKDFVTDFEYDMDRYAKRVEAGKKGHDPMMVADGITEYHRLLDSERARKYNELVEITKSVEACEKYLKEFPDDEATQNLLYQMKSRGIEILRDEGETNRAHE